MKIEWKKDDKSIYVPKNQPERVHIPRYRYFMIDGKGNPNEPFFEDYIKVLYALSYGIKMSPKNGFAPSGYQEYTVYPLEGVWDVTEAAKLREGDGFQKSELVFTLMIRQPDFVTPEFAAEIIRRTREKSNPPLIDQVRFESLEEGDCVQMLHIGSYDSEPESFARMEAFCAANHLTRISKTHREIYLSDPRRVSPDKLKTVLRFQVKL